MHACMHGNIHILFIFILCFERDKKQMLEISEKTITLISPPSIFLLISFPEGLCEMQHSNSQSVSPQKQIQSNLSRLTRNFFLCKLFWGCIVGVVGRVGACQGRYDEMTGILPSMAIGVFFYLANSRFSVHQRI